MMVTPQQIRARWGVFRSTRRVIEFAREHDIDRVWWKDSRTRTFTLLVDLYGIERRLRNGARSRRPRTSRSR
jgi:hypothetical protein